PTDGKILLPTLKELPASGVMLKGGAKVTATRSVDGIVVQLPGKVTDPDVSVARLEFPGALTITQKPYATPDTDGTLTLLALDADPFGAVGGNIIVQGTGSTAYLTHWKLPNYRIEYRVKTGKTGKWKVMAEVAASKATRISLKVGKSSQSIDIPATGGELKWKTVPLGEIELPEEAVIEIKPDATKWHPIQLRKIILTPIKG
ncbi:MAG: hypothetical protein KJO79_00695, partial [Verrucomicrobiae bacterium]|nr:hypothetical protein [Verrucomicrobiae bacterium]NNJ85661.1 hypothetical protein [Akkermansiaceae bacterium]